MLHRLIETKRKKNLGQSLLKISSVKCRVYPKIVVVFLISLELEKIDREFVVFVDVDLILLKHPS